MSRLRRWACACATTIFGSVGAQTPRVFELDDLYRIDRVDSVAISPQGDQLAVVVQRPLADSYIAHANTLWLVAARGGAPRRVADDPKEKDQSAPAWSADGRKLAYLGKGEKGVNLRLMDLDAGHAATTLTPCAEQESVSMFVWAPRGARMAIICEKPIVREPDTATIIIASQSSLFNGAIGASWDRRLVVFDTVSGKGATAISSPALLNVQGAVFWGTKDTLWALTTPDGDLPGMEFTDERLIKRIDLATGRVVTLPVDAANVRLPVLSPDGREIVVPAGGNVGIGNWKQTWNLLPFELRRISADHGRLLSTARQPEMYLNRSPPTMWVPAADGKPGGVVYYLWIDRASGRVKGFFPRNGQSVDITAEHVNIDSFSVTADGSQMAVVRGDANTPADVYLLDLRRPAAKPRRLTYFGDVVHTQYAVSEAQALQWRSADDRFEVSGWLLKPAGFVPGQRYPLIVDVHGGPGVLFRNRFNVFRFDGAHQVPPELYVSKGYIVLMVNPRGDVSYGRAYQEALLEGWELPARFDIFSGVDEVVRRGYADPQRMGIAGASYGGWVTAFAISQTHRFKAASANDPVIDSNISSAIAYRGNRLTNYWMHSGFVKSLLGDRPFPSVDPRLVKTPILLRFGLKSGERTHPSEFFISGLQYFAYLDTHCVPVEMIMHTEEGHGVFDPKTWRDYVSRDLAWFDFWLLGKGDPPLKPRSCAL